MENINNQFIQAEIKQAEDNDAVFSVGYRYRVKGKLSLLVNKKGGKTFNCNQVQTIRKFGGRFDNKTEYWYIATPELLDID